MKRILIILLALVITIGVITGCTDTQPGDATGRAATVDETKIQTMIDGFISGELRGEEFFKLVDELAEEEFVQLFDELRNKLGDEEYYNLLGRFLGEATPSTDEELEAQRMWLEELDRTNVDYIIYGEYTPAADDIDLQTIERIVFIDSFDIDGYGFVLDRTHGRVYYDPHSSGVDMLEYIPYSAEFKEEDLSRFIRVIEETGLRDWEEHYMGEIDEDENVMGGRRGWIIAILFSDDTMLRRSGSGMFWTDVAASPDQFAVLTDFIKTIGAEVELRHNAEARSEN